MSAIAAFRTAILALLFDPTSTIFTATNCDDALKWALLEYSFKRPLIRTYQFSVDSSTGIHALPTDFVTRHITNVELYNADPNQITDLAYYAFFRDEGWTIQTLSGQVQAGEVLQISYSDVHQVDGLDGAAGTTVPLVDETLLHVGAAGHAALVRGMGTVEIINMNKDVVRDYRLLAAEYLTRFTQSLTADPGARFAELTYPDLKF